MQLVQFGWEVGLDWDPLPAGGRAEPSSGPVLCFISLPSRSYLVLYSYNLIYHLEGGSVVEEKCQIYLMFYSYKHWFNLKCLSINAWSLYKKVIENIFLNGYYLLPGGNHILYFHLFPSNFFLSILYSHEHAEQVFIILLYHLPFCYDLDPKSLKNPNKYLLVS